MAYRSIPFHYGLPADSLKIVGVATTRTETADAIHRRLPYVAPTRLGEIGPALEAKELPATEKQRLEQIDGIVFDIQRYSLHDGPGLRTSVFLKGCPLRCDWCSNPESQRIAPELVMFEANCLACGACVEACAPGGRTLVDGQLVWERTQCTLCGACARICPAAAVRWSGQRWTAGDVIQEVLRDVPFYEEGGGLTLTGGEPTLQPTFAGALLRLAKAECIHTAIETTGNAPWEVLAQLLPYLDLWLYDLKHMDSKTHRARTGLGNELILSNLRKLATLGEPIRVRVPLIPGFSITQDNMQKTAAFVAELGGAVCSVDLLPYHTLGRGKYAALGRRYPWTDHAPPTDAEVQAAAELVRAHNLSVQIGG
ncbi:glycyl-radical enzyme activating protein [Chloroflexota bacterium]